VGLTQKQIRRLLTPVRGDRTKRTQGNTYVPAHEVKAELSRIFGPGNWDSSIHDVQLIYETSFENPERGNKTYWTVCYRAACTLRIRDYRGNDVCTFTEYHAEENAPQPNRGEAHALCLTSVESYALRRAAIGLGDAMGLHLYNDGSLAPLIKGTLMMEEVFGEAPRQPAQDTLTAEQTAALQNSLGATVVREEPAETPAPATDEALSA